MKRFRRASRKRYAQRLRDATNRGFESVAPAFDAALPFAATSQFVGCLK
jgi:hypothetical protein